MAAIRKTFEQTITSTATPSDAYHSPRGGVLVGDAILTSGTATIDLEISFDNSTFVKAYGSDGAQVSKALATSDPHFRVEMLTHVDVYYRFVASAASSAVVSTKLGRTIAE